MIVDHFHDQLFKKIGDSLKRLVTFAENQSIREACYYLTLMDNTQTFKSHVFVFLPLLWANFKMRGESFTF